MGLKHKILIIALILTLTTAIVLIAFFSDNMAIMASSIGVIVLLISGSVAAFVKSNRKSSKVVVGMPPNILDLHSDVPKSKFRNAPREIIESLGQTASRDSSDSLHSPIDLKVDI